MDAVKTKMLSFYDQIDNVFTPKEAWYLFRMATILETIGWSLLIFGILSKRNEWWLYDWSLGIGGSMHGVFVIFYVLIVFFAHRSMKWTFRQFVAAEILCNIPLGAVVFERYITRALKVR